MSGAIKVITERDGKAAQLPLYLKAGLMGPGILKSRFDAKDHRAREIGAHANSKLS